MTKDSIITLDPSTFSVTNTFAYNSITKISPDDKEKDQFNIEYEKTTYVYKTTYRTKLLCELYHCVVTKIPNKYKSYGKSYVVRIWLTHSLTHFLLKVHTMPNVFVKMVAALTAS